MKNFMKDQKRFIRAVSMVMLMAAFVACNGSKSAKKADAEVQKTVPAMKLTPARQVVKGEVVIGHEVRSFVAEGDTVAYWIIDKTGELLSRYDSLTGGMKNGKPVQAVLRIENVGKVDDGFAADYPAVYHVVGIDTLFVK